MSVTRTAALTALAAATTIVGTSLTPAAAGPLSDAERTELLAQRVKPAVTHNTVKVGDLDVFYREAGDKDAPVLLLLHGFPTSSHMFRNVIEPLGNDLRVIAPDFPGYGHSSMPAHDEFDYTFDNLASTIEGLLDVLEINEFAVYVMDYGAPVGYRLFEADPERVTALIVQNGNAYDEGLDNEFWAPIKKYWDSGSDEDRESLRGLLSVQATEWQYTVGTRNPAGVQPETWIYDQYFLDRPGNQEIQLDLFYDYRTNVPRYPTWQRLFREHQPPTLIIWGKNDPIFPDDGAYPYLRDLEDIEFHLFNTGHFVLEENTEEATRLMRDFLNARVR